MVDGPVPKYYDEGLRSAREIVPIVLEVIRPASVIDVGCGEGNWLAVFREYGIGDIFGVDLHYRAELLRIPNDRFTVHDLTEPLRLNRTFELVVCLEVAEHLPQSCAFPLIESLTNLGPVVLFSAAIPFQGGTGHMNEQWLDYWANLFRQRGYQPIDYIRPKIWDNERILLWYVQNILMFAREDYIASNRALRSAYETPARYPLSLVHPRVYLGKARPNTVGELAGELLKTIQLRIEGWLTEMGR